MQYRLVPQGAFINHDYRTPCTHGPPELLIIIIILNILFRKGQLFCLFVTNFGAPYWPNDRTQVHFNFHFDFFFFLNRKFYPPVSRNTVSKDGINEVYNGCDVLFFVVAHQWLLFVGLQDVVGDVAFLPATVPHLPPLVGLVQQLHIDQEQ